MKLTALLCMPVIIFFAACAKIDIKPEGNLISTGSEASLRITKTLLFI